MIDIILPFPPALLSGHAKGHWRSKASVTAKWREDAKLATQSVFPPGSIKPFSKGDIRVIVTFYPANRRGDRVNFPNRCKPLWDGIADALKVNDSRFLPTFVFGEPSRDPRVVFSILGR